MEAFFLWNRFYISALCRLEMGTTCNCTEGDFSSPMKYWTIASRPGRISDYQTFKLLLILCRNKNCCKPFLRSLHCWRVARSFLFSQHRLWKASIVNWVRQRKGWRALADASPVPPAMPCFWAALFRRIVFLHLSQLRKSPYTLPSAFLQYRGCYATAGKYHSFPRVPSCFGFSQNKTKFDHHKSLSALWRAPQNTSQRRGLKHQEWMHCRFWASFQGANHAFLSSQQLFMLVFYC